MSKSQNGIATRSDAVSIYNGTISDGTGLQAVACHWVNRSNSLLKIKSNAQYLPEQLVKFQDLEQKSFSGPVNLTNMKMEVDGVAGGNTKITEVLYNYSNTTQESIVLDDGETDGIIIVPSPSPEGGSLTLNFTGFNQGYKLSIKQSSNLSASEGNIWSNHSGGVSSYTARIKFDGTTSTPSPIGGSGNRTADLEWTNTSTYTSGQLYITYNGIDDQTESITVGDGECTVTWDYSFIVTIEKAMTTEITQMCRWEDTTNSHYYVSSQKVTSVQFTTFPSVANTTLITDGEIDLHLVQTMPQTLTSGQRVVAPFSSGLKYWRIGLMDLITNKFDYSGSFERAITNVELIDYLTDSSSNTTSQNTADSMVKECRDEFKIPSNIAGSEDAYILNCVNMSACVYGSYNAQYSYATNNDNSLGLVIRLNTAEEILPDGAPIAICSVVINFSYKFVDEVSARWSGTLKINLWYDNSYSDTIDDILCKYTTSTSTDIDIKQGSQVFTNSGGSVVPISSKSFNSLTKQGELTLSSAPVGIKQSGFASQETLKTVTLPAGIRTLSANSFYNCPNLTSVQFTNQLQLIGDSTFENCSNYSICTIPKSHSGDLTFGKYVFKNSNVSQINIYSSGSVTFSESCFAECPNLSLINIATNTIVKDGKIPKQMCYNSGPVQFVVPQSVTIIGESAFEKSRVLVLNIPAGAQLTSIEQNAFKDSELFKATFSSSLLKTIKKSAFEGSKLEGHLQLSDGLTTIGQRAFAGTYITELTIPSTVTQIDISGQVQESTGMISTTPFTSCYDLRTVHWNATNYTSSNQPLEDVAQRITTLTIGNNVQYIPQGLFERFSIQSITLNTQSNLKEIGPMAFQSCTQLCNDVTLHNNLQTLGNSVFKSCTTLPRIQFGTSLKAIPNSGFFGCMALQVAEFPSNSGEACQCTTIETDAFKECYYLRTVRIPKSVTRIKDSAFENCTSYTFTYSSWDNTKYASTSNYMWDSIKIIEGTALDNTKWFNDHSTGELWMGTIFYGVKNSMNHFRYPTLNLSNATCISGSSFGSTTWNDHAGAYYVDSITLPTGNCIYIGPYAFDGCTQAHCNNSGDTYTFNGTETIGSKAFNNCSWLFAEKALVFTNSLSYLGAGAFAGTTFFYGSANFRQCSKLTSVPASLFAQSGIWYFLPPPNITQIGQEAFYKCSHLAGFNSTIADKCCITPNITVISAHAFQQCDSLPSIEIQGQDVTIYTEAFRGCSAVTSLKFKCGSSVTIHDQAFYNCQKLKTIYLPKNVSIKKGAFASCGNITTVYYEGTQAEWQAFKDYQNSENLNNRPLWNCSDVRYSQSWTF